MFGIVLTSVVSLMHVYLFWRAGSVPLLESFISRKALIGIGLILWMVFYIGRRFGHGGTAMTKAHMEKIAHFLNISLTHFIDTYTIMCGSRHMLCQGEDGYCIFHKDGKCGIHPVKPDMCKKWPYLPNVVRAPENWQIMAGSCPGIKTDLPLDQVVACICNMQ